MNLCLLFFRKISEGSWSWHWYIFPLIGPFLEAHSLKGKIDKLDFVKIKHVYLWNFLLRKAWNYYRIFTDFEKLHIYRRLESKYINNSQKSRVRNDKPIRKHIRDMKRLFSEGYTGDK